MLTEWPNLLRVNTCGFPVARSASIGHVARLLSHRSHDTRFSCNAAGSSDVAPWSTPVNARPLSLAAWMPFAEGSCRPRLELRAQNNPSTEASINNSAAGTTPIEEIAPPRPDRVPCLFIDKPVRSGQIIEFPAGDVTVIGSVGSGAEINAGGSIHVYGTLRGRALAGTAGDCAARISAAAFMPSLWRSMAITVWRTTWIRAYGVAQFRLGLRDCE